MKTFILIILFSALSSVLMAADYTVGTGVTSVDGDTFCGGVCTSADKIIMDGGARGSIIFQDFDGGSDYIVITNENINPDEKVIITDDAGNVGTVSIVNCRYVDFRGDNDVDLSYGIKVINDGGTPGAGKGIFVSTTDGTKSDYIKISYIEVAFDGNTKDDASGTGIQVTNSSLSASVIFSNYEIHHNYIHGSRYAGMYLGNNDPSGDDNPWLQDWSVHDNIVEDSGAYGITFKGGKGTSNSFYSNTIKRTGIVTTGTVGGYADSARHGAHFQWWDTGAYVNAYDNWIEDTKGPGLMARAEGHQIYDNIILGCGTGDDTLYGHGIVLDFNGGGSNDIDIFDNVILQATRYGIYDRSTTGATNTMDRNLIGDCGQGEEYDANSTMTEGTGADVNIYYASVADFNFNTWSDDSDYSNDLFRTRNLSPVASGTDVAIGANLTWTNFGDVTGVDVFFDKTTNPPTTKVVDNTDVEIYNPGTDLDISSTYYWQIVTYGGVDTGTVYSFGTASGPPVDPTKKGSIGYDSGGGSIKYDSGGMTIQ